MTYQIDQSNKVEQTERDTVVALSNDLKVTLLFRKQDKRRLQSLFKQMKQTKFFQYITFAAIVAVLICEAKSKSKVVIDREYAGHEDLILEKISTYLKLLRIPFYPQLQFAQIGKTSPAHHLAADVTVRGKKANKVLKLKEIVNLIFPKKMIGTRTGEDRLTSD